MQVRNKMVRVGLQEVIQCNVKFIRQFNCIIRFSIILFMLLILFIFAWIFVKKSYLLISCDYFGLMGQFFGLVWCFI